MSVTKVGVGRVVRRDLGREKPRRRRLGLLLLLSLVAGGTAGIIAFTFIWLPTLFGLFHPNATPPEIAANMVFPVNSVIHKTVIVYDPPVYQVPTRHREGAGGGGDD